MSGLTGNPFFLASAAGGGYQISRSLRFNSSDSAYLSRTPSTAGNRKTWTWAGWVKASRLGTYRGIFEGYTGSPAAANRTSLQLANADQIDVLFDNTSSGRLTTTQVFRDPSAWYHIVFACDTTQATASNRFKIYINGSQVTTFAAATYPSQNYDTGINTTQAHYMGRVVDPFYADFYLADIHFIDGQALTPSSFTEVSATTGRLEPKAYSGPTPTGNSFWLPFSDNSAATATTLGKDGFLLGNNWTPNNLSVTAGSGNDSLVDTPTSYGTDTGVGGEVRGNYCTFNPLVTGKTFTKTLTNGNLNASITAATNGGDAVFSTFQVNSGKCYLEFQPTDVGAGNGTFGIGMMRPRDVQSLANSYAHMGITQYGYGWNNRGDIFNNNVASAVSSSYVANDILMMAVDFNAGKLWFGKNGTWLNSGIPAAGTGAIYTNVSSAELVAFGMSMGAGTATTISCAANWGARPFAYTAPSGFKALCDTNLPSPQVAKPNTVMDVVTYTGTGSTRSISSLNFSPDFLWFKSRSSTNDHVLFDAVRGRAAGMRSNGTDAEYTSSAGNDLASFDSAGFTVGAPQNWSSPNGNGLSVVAWAWDAGSTTVTNTQGSITSSVRANPSAGFSVVTYTGTGSGGTIGHGLGVAPQLVFQKIRNTTGSWQVYHASIGATQFLNLDTTDAAVTSSLRWNNTAPTSTVVTVGTVGGSAYNYVLYCFAPVAGYSSGFSYTGNGSADGVFQSLGFRPRLIMLKRSDSTSNWTLLDTSREGYNVDNDPLYPNLSDAEGTTDLLDITSNGFKLRSTDASVNASAGTYIGFAWAENPFQYARAR